MRGFNFCHLSESSETSSVAYRLFPNLLYHKACEFMFQELPEKGVVEFTASLQYLESDGRTSMWPYAATSDGRLLALFRHHMILEARLNTGRALSGLRMDVEEPEMAAIAYMQEYVDNAREDSCVYDVALCDLFMANFYLDIIRKNACPGESSLHLLEAKMQDTSTRRIPIFDKLYWPEFSWEHQSASGLNCKHVAVATASIRHSGIPPANERCNAKMGA